MKFGKIEFNVSHCGGGLCEIVNNCMVAWLHNTYSIARALARYCARVQVYFLVYLTDIFS